MEGETLLEIATGSYQEVPPDWMPAGEVRSFIFDDPVLVWLKYHGKEHGFEPDSSPYEFSDFLFKKGRQFEEKWVEEMAQGVVGVCVEPFEVRSADKLRETFHLMQEETPLIAQPALWWAPERIYGAPDLLAHTSWLRENFPDLLEEAELQGVAIYEATAGKSGHYVVLDIKFTRNLDNPRDPQKVKDLRNYGAQVRLYSYMLGHLQEYMPQKGYIITRDRISSLLPVPMTSEIGKPLDTDLGAIRDKFLDIKINGGSYLPWRDEIVASNPNGEEGWRTAKRIIATEKVTGRDTALLYQIGRRAKEELASMGYPNLDSLLKPDPEELALEDCTGLGPALSKRIRAILQANRSGLPVLAQPDSIPPRKRFEFYVDFEFFNNLNVDFDTQWPELDGCEMVFMIGVGREEGEAWVFETFVAGAEDQDEELKMFERFLEFLKTQTEGKFTDDDSLALYHWWSAEVTQARGASKRHDLDDAHPLRNLPWYDLQKVFLNSPCGIPGAWNYTLKDVAKALGKLSREYDPQWPGDLDEGLLAMVMGWRAFESAIAMQSAEMSTLTQYLEADCKALRNILKWIRS